MKKLFTLIFVCSIFSASAQLTASLQKPVTTNNICLERGHNFINKNATTAKCSRCGVEVNNSDKEVKSTTGSRIDKKFSSLDDIKKVATLRNDTLFIHKRIAPFASVKEQSNSTITLFYKDKPITFKAAIFDESTFYTGKNGLEIF